MRTMATLLQTLLLWAPAGEARLPVQGIARCVFKQKPVELPMNSNVPPSNQKSGPIMQGHALHKWREQSNAVIRRGSTGLAIPIAAKELALTISGPLSRSLFVDIGDRGGGGRFDFSRKLLGWRQIRAEAKTTTCGTGARDLPRGLQSRGKNDAGERAGG